MAMQQVAAAARVTRQHIKGAMRSSEIEAAAATLTLPPLAAGPSLSRGERGLRSLAPSGRIASRAGSGAGRGRLST